MDVRTFENARWNKGPQSLEFRHRAAAGMVTEGPVLDIGCGDGTLMRLLRDRGVSVSGMDMSDAAVRACQEEGFETVLASGTDGLPFGDGAFPSVIALDVLEHVYDPLPLLAEMARVSSFAVIIGVPNFSSLPSRIQTLFGQVPENNRPSKGHVYWFNWRILVAMAASAGLRIEQVALNVPGERIPVAGRLLHLLGRAQPNLFALSFVVRLTVSSSS